MAGIPEGFHRVNFNCPIELFEQLKECSETCGIPRSKLFIMMVEEFLQNRVQVAKPVNTMDLPAELRVLLGQTTSIVERPTSEPISASAVLKQQSQEQQEPETFEFPAQDFLAQPSQVASSPTELP